MVRSKRVPVVLQMSAADCGAACLAMVVRYWGGRASVGACQTAMGGGAQGVTALMIAQAARAFGFTVQAFRHTPAGVAQAPLPAIIHWQGIHFVVLEAWNRQTVTIVDPALGRRSLTAAEFAAGYSGVTLTLQPGSEFDPKRMRSGGGTTTTWRSYVRRIATVPGSRTLLGQLLLASLFLQLAGLTVPVATWWVVEQVGLRSEGEAINLALWGWLGVGLALAALAQAGVTYLRALLVIRLQQRLDRHLIPAFFAHLLRLPYPFFQQRTTGDLIARVAGNSAIRELIITGVLTGLLDGGLALLYLLILYNQAPLFGLLMTLTAVAQLLLLTYSGERMHEHSQLTLATQAEEEGFAVQLLRGIETIKAAGTERWILEQWQSRFVATLQASLVREHYAAQLQGLIQWIHSSAPLLLLWIGVRMVAAAQLSLGQMLALVVLATSTLAPLSNLAGHLRRVQQLWAYLERLDDVWSATPEVTTAETNQAQISLCGGIEVANLAFQYGREGVFALQDVTFRIAPGEKVAIIGPTGAGKSTLVRLLLALYRPTQGVITYDGYTAEAIGLTRLRQSIGVVLQDAFLLSGSIRANIALHQPEMPLAQVMAAAKAAAIHDEISRLPMGYETTVGEGGSGLSGGQRQRLALARALAIHPAILILDEATSHLDTDTESTIQQALDGLSMTQLIIAHRLSTIRNADRILKLEAGRLVELDRQHFLAHDRREE